MNLLKYYLYLEFECYRMFNKCSPILTNLLAETLVDNQELFVTDQIEDSMTNKVRYGKVGAVI